VTLILAWRSDDELKPLTGGWTDSFGELGNARTDPNSKYKGIAMTLIDGLVLGY
jgi:hypothetical protein